MPSMQSGVWPWQRAGGCLMRLQGLHGRSTRTMLALTESGPHRSGEEGPNSATIGVPTAAARCIGPVSGVMNNGQAREHGGQREQIGVTDGVDHDRIARQGPAHVFGGGPIGRRSRQHDHRATLAHGPRADVGQPRRRPLLHRAPGADVQADQGPLRRRSRRRRQQRVSLRVGRSRNGEGGTRKPRGRLATLDGPFRAGRGIPERRRHQPHAVHGRMRSRVEADIVIQQGPAARHAEARAPARAGARQEDVAADIAFEVDGEVIAPRPPGAGLSKQRGPAGRLPRPEPATAHP